MLGILNRTLDVKVRRSVKKQQNNPFAASLQKPKNGYGLK
jgi:hypothetical protein